MVYVLVKLKLVLSNESFGRNSHGITLKTFGETYETRKYARNTGTKKVVAELTGHLFRYREKYGLAENRSENVIAIKTRGSAGYLT